MNRYENYGTSHRVALGTAAIALTVLGIGLLLVVPASMTPGNPELRTPAVAPAVWAADEGNGRLHVEVTAAREPSVASAQTRTTHAKRKQQG